MKVDKKWWENGEELKRDGLKDMEKQKMIMIKKYARTHQFLSPIFIILIFLWGVSLGAKLGFGDNEEKGKGFEIGGFHINGKIDINFESRGYNSDPFKGTFSIVNYHHFLFVSRKDKNFFMSINIPDLWFYEFGYTINEWLSVKGGKILVPIGADPLFHHEYGGLTGFDQKFLPYVWSEHGVNVNLKIIKKEKFLVSSDIFTVNAPKGNPDSILLLTERSQPDKFALGGRLKVGYSGIIGFFSLYWNQYKGKYDFVMPGVDISISYGTIPFAKFLAIKAGFLRPYVEGNPEKVGTYYHFADYIRFDVKLPLNFSLRYIAGTKTIQNYKGFFYDKEMGDDKDSTTHNFAIFWRKEGFLVGVQYVINLEAKEIKDDFARIILAYEF